MWRNSYGWLALATIMAAPMAKAQSGSGDGFLFREPSITLSMYGGFALPGARSDLFDFTMSELTIGRGDFAGPGYGGDLGVRVGDRFEAALGISHAATSTRSEFRDWVDGNDQPIEQVTRFSRTPVSISLKFHPMGSGRQVGSFAWIPSQFDPWVGLGVGRMKYIFEQSGDFIDYETDPNAPVVFTDRFRTEGWAGMFQASTGAGWTLSPHWQLTGELRYQNARGKMSDDFVGFEKLDLSGISTSVGLAVRF